MSLPWLRDDYKKKSKSKSRSRSRSRSSSGSKGRTKVDAFGRTVPRRSRSGSSSKNKKKGRESKRSKRSRSSSSNSSTDSNRSLTRPVASERPKYTRARLFVANIISKKVTKEELVRHFEKYGSVVDILIHPKNYAFVQFGKEEHARLAVEGESGSTFRGWRLDVKMAVDGRKNEGPKPGRGGRGGGRGRGDHGPKRDYDDRPRGYDAPVPGYGPPPPPPDFAYDRMMPYPPPPGFSPREPYPIDPYKRPFEPWIPPDDPYRSVPFVDPYREPYPPRPPPPTECEIFLVNSQLRAYGEAIERRVRDDSIITAVSIIPEGRTAPQMVQELTARNGLFAIFVNAQNEQHRSLTLNILHGTPQEHRNMPLDDAITLVGRSFETYVRGLREKAEAASVPKSTPSFLPPSSQISYLLNLLADNRALTVSELTQVMDYLQERKIKLLKDEGKLPDTAPSNQPEPGPSRQLTDDLVKKSQDDLTSKILSIFNGAGGSVKPATPATVQPGPSPPATVQPGPAPPPAPTPAPPPAGAANLINFDNPNVQKALDNLIQSSPNLLKNIKPTNFDPPLF